MTPFKFGKKKARDGSGALQGGHQAGRTPQQQVSGHSPHSSTASTVSQPLSGGAPGTAGSAASAGGKTGFPQLGEQYPQLPKHQHPPQQHPPQHAPQPQGLPPRSPRRSPSAKPISAHQPQPGPQPGPHDQPQDQVPSPWSQSKLLISPFPRYRHAASNYANDKNEVLVMGGLHNTSVYGDTWIIKPTDNAATNFQSFQLDIYDNSPAPRVGHASTLCGNAYVIFGGDTVTNDQGEIDNDLYLFNMNSHTWTIPKPVGEKPCGRYGHSIGVIAITNFDSKLYLYGGQLDDIVYDDLIVFNLSSFRRPDVHWQWIKPDPASIRPPPLTNHTMDVYDNKLWIFGGSNGSQLSNSLYSFDPITNSWENVHTFGAVPKPIEEHSSVIYKDLLIVYGGKDYQGEASSDMYFLNLITKTWFKYIPTIKNSALEPLGKYGHSLTLLKNDKLLVCGGHLPDYANPGDNFQVSNEDQGVGTILQVFDLSDLEKLVPGLQQYSTPQKVIHEKFSSQQHHYQQQPIFTPPASQARSVIKSPEMNYDDFENEEEEEEEEHKSGALANSTRKEIDPQFDQADEKSPFRAAQELSPPKTSYTNEDLPLELPTPVTTNLAKNVLKDGNSSTENFITPVSTTTNENDNANPPPKSNEYFTEDSRHSNILDSYVGSHSASEIDLSANDATAASKEGKDSFLPAESSPLRNQSSKDILTTSSTETSVPPSASTPTINRHVSNISIDDKLEFKQIIQHLTSELNQLKVSTTEEISRASAKVSALELENKQLKQAVAGGSGAAAVAAAAAVSSPPLSTSTPTEATSKEISVEVPDDENELKKSFLKLSTDYKILHQKHDLLENKIQEIEPVFSDNLINLSQLNSIIASQAAALEESHKQLKEQEDFKAKYLELENKYKSLEASHFELSEQHEKSLASDSNQIVLLNTNITKFLSQHLDANGEPKSVSKEIGGSASAADIAGITQPLHEHIEKLVADNQSLQNLHKDLQQQVDAGKAEIEALKARIQELAKFEENYRESVHSVTNASRALELSQSELNKEKEINRKLQHALDELKMLKKPSRVSTPVVGNSSLTTPKTQTSGGFDDSVSSLQQHGDSTEGGNSDEDDFDDIENAHLNMKIRDLQAELFITKQERDQLKDDVLDLKKKLLKNGSF